MKDACSICERYMEGVKCDSTECPVYKLKKDYEKVKKENEKLKEEYEKSKSWSREPSVGRIESNEMGAW